MNRSTPPVQRLRDIPPAQWKSGIAAWLGWLFDGLDMHLYTLIAIPFVATLLRSAQDAPEVRHTSAWIQAAFLFLTAAALACLLPACPGRDELPAESS